MFGCNPFNVAETGVGPLMGVETEKVWMKFGTGPQSNQIPGLVWPLGFTTPLITADELVMLVAVPTQAAPTVTVGTDGD